MDCWLPECECWLVALREREGDVAAAWGAVSGGVETPVSESSELWELVDVSGTSAGVDTRGEGLCDGNGYSSVVKAGISNDERRGFKRKRLVRTGIKYMLGVK